MQNIPSKIYIQVGEDIEPDDDFSKLYGVTWCAKRIHETDIEYTLITPAESTPTPIEGEPTEEAARKWAEDNCNGFVMRYDGAYNGFKAGVQWQATQQKNGEEWISVDDKDNLPEFGKEVLVVGEAKGMNPQMGGAYVFTTKRVDLSGTSMAKDAARLLDENLFRANYVTHWMPLPKLPQQNNNPINKEL